jgi:hypothetical protein
MRTFQSNLTKMWKEGGKMAEDTDQCIDCTLEDIVNAMNQSKHVKSELKKSIMEAVSTLRNIFYALKKDIVDKSAKNTELETEVNQARQELQAYRDTRLTTPVATSSDRMKTLGAHASATQHPSSGRKMKFYTDIVAGRENNKKFKITIRSKGYQAPETIKQLIKTKINPTEMKVGISAFRALKDGRILIETGSKEEIEKISTSITEKCGKELETKVQELKNSKTSNM